jgi:hypothetical protein
MPKIIQPSELDKLIARIGRHPDGIGIELLLKSLRWRASRRTLQRRLAQLIEQGRLQAQGVGRSVTYRLPVITATLNAALEPVTLQANGENYVPPIGYRVELLDAYEPNVTFYLPAPLREQLRGLGRAPVRVDTQAAVAGTFARDILNRLLIDLSWASSRLEGNTYSRLDTERLFETGIAAAGKGAFETQMILNHKAAIEYLVLDAKHARVTEHTLFALHALLSDGLLADPSASGRLRRRAVEIAGSVYRPLALPQRLEALFRIVVERAASIEDAFEQSFFLMVHLPYLQPFEDMNKRVSRLAANIPFIRADLSPLSFIDVPERAYIDGTLAVYELNDVSLLRDVFVWAYERSCQQYVAIRSQLVAPDLFRLRHRVALGQTIRALVQAQRAATPARIRRSMPSSVPPTEREAFVRLVLAELPSLHAGNAVRFGLRPLEVEAWQPQPPKK